MKDISVSVIIPVYNAAPWLERCVDSVRSQSVSNIEVLLIDDGSTDGSGAMCELFAGDDPRIRVFHQPNGGVSAARNLALRMARGRWLAFVDADDTLPADSLQLRLDAGTRTGADAVASVAADHGTYLLDRTPAQAAFVWIIALIAALELIAVIIFAWRSGRGYCNTICPVGTFLGLISRFSLFKPVINLEKCNSCGSCGRHCKASCINTKAHEIDYSRCVVCMDCINNCSQGAISYSLRRRSKTIPATDAGRRNFMVGAAMAAGAGVALAADKTTDGGLAPLKEKKRHKSIEGTVPAGAISLRHLRSHCTACQLCISACPSGVLKPSLSLSTFMQPEMTFTDGFCRPECTACADICPAGAILPIDKAEKSSTKIGTAKVDASLCISAAYGQTCGNCARHCPVHAIRLVKNEQGHMRPTVDESRCIGCGACEYHCPVGTAGMISSCEAAIYVEGIETHRTI